MKKKTTHKKLSGRQNKLIDSGENLPFGTQKLTRKIQNAKKKHRIKKLNAIP